MNRTRAFTLTCSLLLAAPLAFAQASPQTQPPPGQFGGPGSPMGGRLMGKGYGMGIVPPGTWWKNPDTIAAVGLTVDQQKHLDDIFLQSRPQLMQLKASLDEEQRKLQPMLSAGNVDQGSAYAEISRIADLRAELEKTNAKMLLSLRALLTADQWAKLQAQRPMHREGGPDGFRQHGPNPPPGPAL